MAGEQPNDTQETPSLRDFLGDAIQEHDPEPAAAAPAAAPAPAETRTDAAGRVRGADGKFASTGATADTPAHIAGAAVAQPAQVAAAPANGAAPEGAPQSPQSWKAEAKAHWDALPAEVRQEVQRREREISTGLQRAHQAQEFSNSMMQEFQPYADILRQEGATPQAAMRTLLETAYTLRHGSPEHKHALMLSLAQQYGIDLNKQINPELAKAQWEADSLRAANMRNAAGGEQAQMNEVRQVLNEFISQPGHEHYETVKNHMIALLNNGQAEDLQEAYDQAVWANPQTRKVMMEQTQLQQNTQRAADLGRNRAAASAVKGAPGSVAVTPQGNKADLRATIEAAMGGRDN